MTPLEGLIREMIAAEGPMRLDRYMAICLGHPVHGYYMAREAFGEDFITAPEISQVFGELIGIWCAAAWQAMGAPASFNLVELGPGRGTLIRDILRAARVMPGLLDAAKVHLVEISQRLRELQKDGLGSSATWHDTLVTVPEGPMVLLANEFFDALPIRQFQRSNESWLERYVRFDGGELRLGFLDTHLRHSGESRNPASPWTPAFAGVTENLLEGNVLEWSPARNEAAAEIGARLKSHPGVGLIVDYGHFVSAPGDTLQAVRKHMHVPITEAPGECDLTSHVDFEALAKALRQGGAAVWPAVTQRAFLLAMGVEARTAALAARADRRMADMLQRAMARLVDEAQMGNLFKVLAATSPGIATPYPFGER